MTLGTLREMSAKTTEKRSPVAVNACLAAIKTIFCTKRYEDKQQIEFWDKLLKASLTTVLRQSKPGIVNSPIHTLKFPQNNQFVDCSFFKISYLLWLLLRKM